MSPPNKPLDIIIIGAGIGGLTAAITCRRANPPMRVRVLERCPEILTVGAGIHVPPNACRILTDFGLLGKLKQAGGYQVDDFVLRRYANGQTLACKPLRERVEKEYGSQWIAIHRGDYQSVLLDEAMALGAEILTHAEAVDVHTGVDTRTAVLTRDGRTLLADVVIGADGLWSHTREMVLGRPLSPQETGDLAYRATFTRHQLERLGDESVSGLLDQSNIQVWLGPGKHAVFYPLRNRAEYNLVLLVADDLPAGVRTAKGTVEEMVANFDGWDPRLKKIMSCSGEPLKWKLLHFEELSQWTRETVALLGDACHPSLPYLGQGAAMAVEDGATLGLLLSRYSSTEMPKDQRQRNQHLKKLLKHYQDLRKARAEIVVAGATDTRYYYHLPDGPDQRRRDRELASLADTNWNGPCEFNWGDAKYQRDLLSFDALRHVDVKRWPGGVSVKAGRRHNQSMQAFSSATCL